RLFTILRGLGIDRVFDTVTISSLTQAAKPAPKMFQAALEKHALDPEEAMHVGDSLRDDAEGAIRAGIKGILLDRESRCSDTLPAGAVKISTLSDLLPLLAESR
ncbi:MAG TPA: HAD family hydrolase, partial [Nitrospira sp.]